MGRGVPKDEAEAAALYLKAAQQGNSAAQVSLAYTYEMGRGMPKDKSQAISWYVKAAEQGNPDAQRNLSLENMNNKLTGTESLVPISLDTTNFLKLAIEHGYDSERDLRRNLWASAVNEARHKQEDDKFHKGLGPLVEKMKAVGSVIGPAMESLAK
jgi:TPR repeat protein